MKKKDEHVLSLLVDNKFGVLTRIITGVRKEGCNIKSLTAATTVDKEYSRITINIECYDYLLDDVINRMQALNCVKSLTKYEEENFVEKEYVIFSVVNECPVTKSIIDRYKANKIKNNMYELSGDRNVISQLIDELSDNAHVDIARTGSIILQIPNSEV